MTHSLVLDDDEDPIRQQKWTNTQRCKIALSIPLLVIGISLLLTLNTGSGNVTERKCIKHMSAWSPALSAVEYEWVTYQNAFSQRSPYRGTPNPKIEAEWESLYQYGSFEIAAKDRERGDSGDSVDELPSVDKTTVGNLLIYRQLYCLNLLRQHTYRLEYNYSDLASFSGTENQVMEHADRCIETLRKTLMCSGDTTPYLIMLTPERPGGESPDFNTLHGCRKMDKIMRWSEENALISERGEIDGYMFTHSVY